MAKYVIEVRYVTAVTYVGIVEIDASDEEDAIRAARHAHNADAIPVTIETEETIQPGTFDVVEWSE